MTSPESAVSDPPDTLMWEVRAEPGRRQELLARVEERALPELAGRPGFLRADIYCGGQDRVVVVGSDELGDGLCEGDALVPDLLD